MKENKPKTEMLKTFLEQRELLNKELDRVQSEIAKMLNGLEEKELEEILYEELKTIYKKEHFHLESATRERFLSVMKKKKLERYPQLRKPTYFPEIDTLNLSDQEKLRIDKAARKNIKFYMSEDSLKWNEFGLSLNDLELLRSINVAKKVYEFYCPDCQNRCMTVSEEDMEKHKRVWVLEKIQDPSQDENDEFDRLQYDYGCIYLECMDCGISYEITNEKQLNDFKKYMKTMYKIVKKPDLSFEEL